MPGTFSPPPRVSDPNMHRGTCAMLGSLTGISFEVDGGANVPGIPGAGATGNFTCLVRGPCPLQNFDHFIQASIWRHAIWSFYTNAICLFIFLCMLINTYPLNTQRILGNWDVYQQSEHMAFRNMYLELQQTDLHRNDSFQKSDKLHISCKLQTNTRAEYCDLCISSDSSFDIMLVEVHGKLHWG